MGYKSDIESDRKLSWEPITAIAEKAGIDPNIWSMVNTRQKSTTTC